MARPDYVNLTCPHCGYKWLEATRNLLAAEVVIYRGGETVKRRIRCPNCDKDVIVDVPKEWLDNE